MNKQTYTAAEVLAYAAEVRKLDDERMARRPSGLPRNEWRQTNPLAIEHILGFFRDAGLKSSPKRFLSLNGDKTVTVWTTYYDYDDHQGRKLFHGKLIENISLTAPDADERLARYRKIAQAA